MKLLPLKYQYHGQYDDFVRIEIDDSGVMTKTLGNYRTQAPVKKKLTPVVAQKIERILREIDRTINSDADQLGKEFVATLDYGSGFNTRRLHWYGPASNQAPVVNHLVRLLVTL